MSLEALRREIGAVNDLLCAASILVWDSRTMMPAGGVEARGYQIATLMEGARERLLSPRTLKALDGAEAAVQIIAGRRRAPGGVRRAGRVDFHTRIPADLIRRKAELRPKGERDLDRGTGTDDFLDLRAAPRRDH
jgi:carboxypeptidase Taq